MRWWRDKSNTTGLVLLDGHYKKIIIKAEKNVTGIQLQWMLALLCELLFFFFRVPLAPKSMVCIFSLEFRAFQHAREPGRGYCIILLLQLWIDFQHSWEPGRGYCIILLLQLLIKQSDFQRAWEPGRGYCIILLLQLWIKQSDSVVTYFRRFPLRRWNLGSHTNLI